jgi:hypothetical protein
MPRPALHTYIHTYIHTTYIQLYIHTTIAEKQSIAHNRDKTLLKQIILSYYPSIFFRV